jgi:hypothetical protein
MKNKIPPSYGEKLSLLTKIYGFNSEPWINYKSLNMQLRYGEALKYFYSIIYKIFERRNKIEKIKQKLKLNYIY